MTALTSRVAMLAAHKEWAPRRKDDPLHDMAWRRGRVRAQLSNPHRHLSGRTETEVVTPQDVATIAARVLAVLMDHGIAIPGTATVPAHRSTVEGILGSGPAELARIKEHIAAEEQLISAALDERLAAIEESQARILAILEPEGAAPPA